MGKSESAWLSTISRENKIWVKQLFERYYASMVLFAQSYIPDQEVAKDIVQDIFLVLIRSQEKFTTIEHLKTYLYSTVKNRCLKHIRHQNVKVRYKQYVLTNENEEANYHERILDEEVFSLLNQAIQELPAQCKNVFLLTLEGKSNPEIAEILGIGIETVKSHKKTGKKILYIKLKDTIACFLLPVTMSL